MIASSDSHRHTVVPDTEQTVLGEAVKVTPSPEVAVALTVSGVPTVCDVIAPKVMACAFPLTVKVWVIGVAAEYELLPDCDAVIEQLPEPTKLTVLPDTVQTVLGEAVKVTARLELADAIRVKDVPTV